MGLKTPFQRFRSGGGFVPVMSDWDSYDRFTCLSGKFHQATWTTGMTGIYRTFSDTVTPEFKRLQSKGAIFNNPMSSSQETQSCSGSFSRVRSVAESCGATHVHNEEDITGPYAYYAQTGFTKLPPVALVTDAEIASAIGVAATRAWEQSNGHLADILVDIAEMRQTLHMFTRPTNAIQPLLRAINSTKAKNLKKLGDVGKASITSAQNMWLQYRYGIRPLVSSVTGILKALDKKPSMKRQTFRGNYSLSKVNSSPGTFDTWSTRIGYNDDVSDVVQIRAGILMEESFDLSTSLGVDGAGLLSLPWEIVPFSFVADWFINVGSFLGGIVPFLQKHPAATWYTVTRQQSRVWKITSTAAVNPASYTIVRPAQEIRTLFLVSKKRVPGIPMPSIRLKPQALKNVLGDLRFLDAAALAMQQLGRAFKG